MELFTERHAEKIVGELSFVDLNEKGANRCSG